jgi:hypothetical protein
MDIKVANNVASTPGGHSLAASTRIGIKETCNFHSNNSKILWQEKQFGFSWSRRSAEKIYERQNLMQTHVVGIFKYVNWQSGPSGATRVPQKTPKGTG